MRADIHEIASYGINAWQLGRRTSRLPRDGTTRGTPGRPRAHHRRPPRRLGLKQEQLALAVGTDQARISRIENAGDNPGYGLVDRIAKALDWELWELAKRAGELETRGNLPPHTS